MNDLGEIWGSCPEVTLGKTPLAGGFQLQDLLGIFTSKIEEDEPIFDEHIFQTGFETTN